MVLSCCVDAWMLRSIFRDDVNNLPNAFSGVDVNQFSVNVQLLFHSATDVNRFRNWCRFRSLSCNESSVGFGNQLYAPCGKTPGNYRPALAVDQTLLFPLEKMAAYLLGGVLENGLVPQEYKTSTPQTSWQRPCAPCSARGSSQRSVCKAPIKHSSINQPLFKIPFRCGYGFGRCSNRAPLPHRNMGDIWEWGKLEPWSTM